MKLNCRTFIPLRVKGNQEKLLSLYIQLLKQDLEWVNDLKNQSKILYEIQRLIVNNIEEIERSSKIEGKNSGYTRISGSDHISLAYMTKATSYTTTILLDNSGMSGTALSPANFSVYIWVFPKDANYIEAALSIEEI